ncbi:tetratricopeptide repeat protein [Kitasatospora sp. NPDC057692]|uniref:tetratricopeptide repeat protein n=1 Tax=Kitasatospora sp. NPDC057692 TaxID=3346215 RepID=UPI0036CF9369
MQNGEDRVRNEVSGSRAGHVWQAGTMHVALGAAVGAGPAPTALASLPAPPVDLVGRGEVSEALLALLAPSAGEGAPVLVSAVAGLAGVGKTALALYAAHEAVRRGWFPGGVLYVPLRGYRPGAGVSGEQAVGALLRALGVRDHDVPPTAEEQAGLYRSTMAGRAAESGAVLVLADDASAAEQVAPLVPADSCHRLLVTSRDSLHSPGFPARLVPLGVLGAAEAGELVATALRRARPEDGRAAAEPRALASIAKHCGYLPLALQIAAALLVDDPGLPLADLAEELADTGGRLDALRHGDGGGMSLAVAGAFELSYRRLEAETARVLRLTAVNPGPDVSTEAVAVLAELGKPAARRHLAALARANLLAEQPVGSGRWRAHDLVRLYAARLLEQDGEELRRVASARLLEYYVDGGHAFIPPGLQSDAIRSASGRFADRASAYAWLTAERDNLTAAITSRTGRDEKHLELARILVILLGAESFLTTLVTVATVARTRPSLVDWSILGNLLETADGTRALLRGEEPLPLAGDRHTEDATATGLGIQLVRTGRYEEAVEAGRAALTPGRSTGSRYETSTALILIAYAYGSMGRVEEAVDALGQALALYQGAKPGPDG